MKKIVTIALVLTASIASANCTLDLKVKKQGSKTMYLNGESISKSTIEKLKSACTINVSTMSESEIRVMTIASLEKRLAKLKK